MGQDTPITVNLASISGKKVEAAFDGGTVTSDSGVLYLRAVDKELGLSDRLSACIADDRHPSYVDHPLIDLLRQRIFQIACGYEDANDCDALRSDPALKMACDRLPITGPALASQPTMSRLENRVRRTELYRLARALVEAFLASYAQAPAVIILDLDDTDDEVHGSQQLALFNGYYDEHCYRPLHIYEGQTGKLITTILRPGRRPTGREIVTILKRLIASLRQAWPKVMILVRGDSHFSCPEVHDFCEANDVYYAFGQANNERLAALGQPLLEQAKALSREQAGPVRLFRSFVYQAASWAHPRRLIFKAEVTEKGENPRFVVTNLESSRASFIYEQVYCARGRMEGFIKNHKAVLHSDRTACHRFEANQFRLLLHSAAYVLLHALATKTLAGTTWACAQFDTIQKRLLKVGARICELATKVTVHWPSSFPLKAVYVRLAWALVPDTS